MIPVFYSRRPFGNHPPVLYISNNDLHQLLVDQDLPMPTAGEVPERVPQRIAAIDGFLDLPVALFIDIYIFSVYIAPRGACHIRAVKFE